MKTMFVLGVLGILIATTTGCKKKYDMDLYPTTGTITIDGQPGADLMVDFRPQESGMRRGSTGYTDEQGHYKMYCLEAEGCVPGKHKVVVSSVAEDSEPLRLDRESKKQLMVEVTSDGENVFDFDLKRKK